MSDAPRPLPPDGPSQFAMFLQHLTGLIPGRTADLWNTYTAQAQSVAGWNLADLQLMLEECRRKLDEYASDVERLRARAQFTFTSSLAAAAVAAATFGPIAGPAPLVLWSIGVLALAMGMLGSLAVVVGKKQMGSVNVHLFTHSAPGGENSPTRHIAYLVEGYLESIPLSANTLATEVTVHRQAVLLVMAGLLTVLLSWLAHISA